MRSSFLTVASILVLTLAPVACGTSSDGGPHGDIDGGDASLRVLDSSAADADEHDAACTSPAPNGGCASCTCVRGQWLCGATQCPPDASVSVDASNPSDASTLHDSSAADASTPSDASNPGDASMLHDSASATEASAPSDASNPSDASHTDGAAPVSCGGSLCGLGEWCDTSEASAVCRCGLPGGACGSGTQCCVFPAGCAILHCNEHCAATCP